MRKRAQQTTQTTSTQTTVSQPAHQETAPERRRFSFASIKARKNLWISVTLIATFFLVLFFNSYFNIVSNANINPQGTDLTTKYYLSGPDPYYNMRLVQQTSATGKFPYYYTNDPLLNYPLGVTGGRAPLLVMSAISFSKLLLPFMSPTDALGFAMQFVPALFGALLVFPVYYIGKMLFGRKEGIIAALLIAIIPIEISSGHGSAFALFDHDSLNLLLYVLTFAFFIKSIKETDRIRSILYGVLAGVPLAALSMVWTEAEFLYAVLAVYIVVQLIIDLVLKKTSVQFVQSSALMMFTAVLVSYPVVRLSSTTPLGLFTLPFFLAAGVTIFGLACLAFKWKNIPWIITIPLIAIFGGLTAGLLYVVRAFPSQIPNFLAPLGRISNILYGTGIYGNKVSLTIAEAGTYNISRTVMSYGPAVYWLAWFGFILLIWKFIQHRDRRDYMFILTLFVVQLWLTSTAGRFLNDMVPVIALLAGMIIWFIIDKFDYKKMIKNIQNAGGGFRGLRRGVKITHIIGAFFIVFVILVPNAFLALDAAVPSAITKNGTSNLKTDVFGQNFTGAFGSSSYKEQYWVGAYDWLRQQDTNLSPADRPAYISWWDYGFYEVAVGGHPTVADNFQDGIPAAANFHTALSEKEGVAVWITRLLLANSQTHGGHLTQPVVNTLNKYLNTTANGTTTTNASKLIQWVQDPKSSPSYNAPIGAQYDKNLSQHVRVGSQWPENAVYLDAAQMLNDSLTDDQITWFYHDIQNSTGKSIRYYGVEGYDEQIFNIFAFLADKSNTLYALRSTGHQLADPEDAFIQVKYTGYQLNADNTPGQEQTWSAQEINNMTSQVRNRIQITGTTTVYKQDYFNTMFYKTYIGMPATQDAQGNLQTPNQQLPTYAMLHFSTEYVSPYPYYGGGKSAVVIAKYYEGAFLNGTVRDATGAPMPYVHVIILDNYGFPHDNVYTDQNGTFSTLAPGGNVAVIMTYPGDELLLNRFRLNDTNNSLYSPITDAEGMRTPGTNYHRNYTININNSNLTGYVYTDTNNNGSYDPGVDTPLANITVHLDDLFFGRTNDASTDANGRYHFPSLPPSKYNISAIQDGYTLNTSAVNVEPATRQSPAFWHNVSKPKPAGINGIIYTDKNDNSQVDLGEATPNVNVTLYYTTLSGAQVPSRHLTTDATGQYSFTVLVPGKYTINASLRNTTTGALQYVSEEPVTLKENVTLKMNISLEYAPITIKGKATHNGTGVGSISISFTPTANVENNTAVQKTTTSDQNGSYTTQLQPGAYNVTVRNQQGSTLVYTYTSKLAIAPGQAPVTYNIALTKVSITVTGTTADSTHNIKNTTITFQPDGSVNNTAIRAVATANATGIYHIELAPGAYNVTAISTLREGNENITYRNATALHLDVKADVPQLTFNILMARVQ